MLAWFAIFTVPLRFRENTLCCSLISLALQVPLVTAVQLVPKAGDRTVRVPCARSDGLASGFFFPNPPEAQSRRPSGNGGHLSSVE